MKINKLLLTTMLLGSLTGIGAPTISQASTTHQHVIWSQHHHQTKHSKKHIKKHVVKHHTVKSHHGTKRITDETLFATPLSNKGFYYQDTAQTESGQAPWQSLGDFSYKLDLHNGNQIYYNNQASSTNYQVIQAAVDAWNQLGVIQLVPTDASNAEIILNDNETADATGAAGITHYAPYYANTGQMAGDVTASLTPYCNDKATDYRTAVMEHEIGHALGFAHDATTYPTDNHGDNATHVMYPGLCSSGDRVIPLGSLEANALREHYGL